MPNWHDAKSPAARLDWTVGTTEGDSGSLWAAAEAGIAAMAVANMARANGYRRAAAFLDRSGLGSRCSEFGIVTREARAPGDAVAAPSRILMPVTSRPPGFAYIVEQQVR